jgi:Protein of unknown function (DUF559)
VLDDLLFLQEGVLSRRQALRFFSPSAIRHRLASGRWRAAHRAVYVTHTGPLTLQQRWWVAVLAAGAHGRPALLGGLSALALMGFRGYPSPVTHIVLPAGRRADSPPADVLVHRTRHLPRCDVHRVGRPPCTMPARSIVDAARWACADEQARSIVAAAFQQRLVSGDELHRVLDRLPRVRRAGLILQTASLAAGGSHSLPELGYLALSRKAGFPEPARQVARRDAAGRRRYLDFLYEEYGVHVEIDGAQHMEVRAAWADMRRQNELWIAGERVLRFPAWLIGARPGEVVAQVRAALTAAGWRPAS